MPVQRHATFKANSACPSSIPSTRPSLTRMRTSRHSALTLPSMSMNTDSAALSNCTSAIVNTVQPHVNDSVSRSERPAVRGAKRKRQGLPEPERQIRRRTIADSIQPTSVVAHGVGPFDVMEIAELLSEGRISELQELLDASWGEQLASDSENQDNLEDNAN